MPVIPNPKPPEPQPGVSLDADPTYRFRGWRINEHPDVGGTRGDRTATMHRDSLDDTLIARTYPITQPDIWSRRVLRRSRIKLVAP